MFFTMQSVRQRTPLYPTNSAEEAVEAVLRTIRNSTRAARDLIGGERPEPGELAEAGEEISGAVASLMQRWRSLDRASPYRAASIDEARVLVEELLEMADGASETIGAALLLEADLSVLVLAQARADAGDRIRTGRGLRSLRRLASDTGIALGYLSDLEGGRQGPPSDEVLRRLEQVLGVDLSVVTKARDRAVQLKQRHQERQARGRRRAAPAQGLLPREEARLRTIASAVADDPNLFALMEGVRQLPPGARRGVEQLVAELLRAFGESEPGPKAVSH